MSQDSILAALAAKQTAGNDGDRSDKFPPGWEPKPGDALAGLITAVTERQGKYGRYPVYTVAPFDGDPVAVHAFHTVLARELADQDAAVGSEVGISYGGRGSTQDGRDCHRYTVVVERHGDEPPVSDVPADPPAATDPEPPAGGDADIPF